MASLYETARTPAAAPPPVYSADGRKAGKRARAGEIDYGRLFEAMRYSRRVLSRFRSERVDIVRQLAGKHYSDGGSERMVPVNHIARFIQIMSRSLVPTNPRVMYSTRDRKSQPAVAVLQEWMNKRIVQMHFGQTLQKWVTDSLLCLGVMKVALASPSDAAAGGYVSPAGVPFAETIDLDDFVCDFGSRDFSQCSFIGHRFRIPRDVAEGLSYYDGRAKKWLAAAATGENRQNNQEGDERVSAVGEGYEGGETRDFEEMVDLWEVYLPRTKRVVTFCSDAGGIPAADCPPLRVQEWMGPPCGPYHFLSLVRVPGNLMPKGPAQDLIDLHLCSNSLYRKLFDQAMRQKTNLPVRGAALDDAKNLIQADDGMAFECENADQLKEVRWGGPDPVNAQFTVHLNDLFNKMGGNLDVLSGAAPQSKTATQDKLLSENASSGVADMQDRTTAGISGVCDAFGWFWWYHPQEVMSVNHSLPGSPDIGIRRNLHPGGSGQPLSREGRYEDLMCRVDPYSLVYRTPQQRLAFIQGLVREWVPMMQVLGSQGIQFDAMAALKLVSEYADEPDVAKIFTVAEPTAPPGGAGGKPPGMAASTTREYVRQSQGQDTEANRANDFSNMNEQAAAEMD